MTRVDLEAAERMLNEATPGPWVVDDDDLSTIWGGGGSVVVCEGTVDSAVDGSTCDRDLIAAAPTLIRSLIEEIERLRMLVAELMDSNDMACETPASACDCSGCSYAREESERV